MDNLIAGAPPSVPVLWRPRPLSKALGEAIYYAERGGLPHPAAPVVVTEARTALHEHEHTCRPAGRSLVLAWLAHLNLILGHPLAEAEFELRGPAVADVLSTRPTCLFTAETWNEAAEKFRFFPGVAEVTELLGPREREATRTLRALRRIAGAEPTPPPPSRPPTEERERILAAFRPQYAEAVAPARAAEAPAGRAGGAAQKAAYLSRGQLIAGYERAAGDPSLPEWQREAARIRLSVLHPEVAAEARAEAETGAETSRASRLGAA